MAGESAARTLQSAGEVRPDPARPVPLRGGGPPARGRIPGLSPARIGMAMFLGSETMFFTGLLGAYLVLRQSSQVWPPPGLPRLPIAVTWANTAVLAASCFAMARALAALKARSPGRLERALTLTTLLGIIFLAVQGSEWIRLVHHGLTVSSGVYGGTFYVLIGVHGLHVLGAVVWLILVLFRARASRFAGVNPTEVDLAGIYWFYVGALWLVIFPSVYLI